MDLLPIFLKKKMLDWDELRIWVIRIIFKQFSISIEIGHFMYSSKLGKSSEL